MNIRGCSPLLLFSLVAFPTFADVIYSNDNPNGLIGVSTNPSGNGRIEHETGDDFFLSSSALITGGTFTGLIPSGAAISDVVVEIYRVFPLDSTVPADGRVLTRVNSPSDVAFDSRDSGASTLTFTTAVLNSSFAVANSVINGINALPNQTTNGEGPASGQEVQFTVNFPAPFTLPADHYFFVPQVELSTGSTFLWLSSTRPTVGLFPPGVTDLQGWTRDENLDPDWSRVGTDIIGGATPPQFNFAFSLASNVPEPSSTSLIVCGLMLIVSASRRKLVG